MKKLKLALAGTWHVHTPMYLEQINEVFGDTIEWVYVWDSNKERAKTYCEKLNAALAHNYQTILDDPAVQVVICEAETYLHPEIVIKAAEAGKHVYTDKTLAIHYKDALAIKNAVEKSGVKFAVSHESIPVVSYQYAKKLVDDGVIGKIISIHFRRAHGFAKLTNHLPANWFSKEIAGGGTLIDLGIHGFSLLTYFCGKPKSISAYIHNFTDHETEDSATVMIEFENGTIGTTHTDMVTTIMDNNFEIVGTDGIIMIQGTEGCETVMVNSLHLPGKENEMIVIPEEKYRKPPMSPVCQFLEFVIDEHAEGQYLAGLDIETALMVVRTVEAAYESAETGQSIAY